MIIKTAESRKLGAKFLDSADALTKTECLHLCCETESCDVFVFEEKVILNENCALCIGCNERLINFFFRVKENVSFFTVDRLRIFDASFQSTQIIPVRFCQLKRKSHRQHFHPKNQTICPLCRCHKMKSN